MQGADSQSGLSYRAILLGGVALLALGGAPSAARAQNYAWDRPNFWVTIEGSHLWASGASQPWTLHTSPTQTLAGSFLDTVRSNRAWGGKIKAGFRIDDTFDLSVAFTGISSRGRTAAADTGAGNCQLMPLVGRYRSCYDAGNARIRSTTQFGDFEVGYNVGLGAAKLRAFAGVRVLRWHQSLDTRFTPYGITTEERIAHFLGAGPRLGIDGQYPVATFGPGSVAVIGSVSGAVIFGKAHDEASSVSRQTGATPLSTFYERDRLATVGNVSASLGLEYRFMLATLPLSVGAGYRMDAFFGLVNTRTAPPPYLGGLGTFQPWPETGSKGGTQIFHGPFVNATLRF